MLLQAGLRNGRWEDGKPKCFLSLEHSFRGMTNSINIPSEIYIILTSKRVFKKLKLFIFSEVDDQEGFFTVTCP